MELYHEVIKNATKLIVNYSQPIYIYFSTLIITRNGFNNQQCLISTMIDIAFIFAWKLSFKGMNGGSVKGPYSTAKSAFCLRIDFQKA
jgi:hypothetical protein